MRDPGPSDHPECISEASGPCALGREVHQPVTILREGVGLLPRALRLPFLCPSLPARGSRLELDERRLLVLPTPSRRSPGAIEPLAWRDHSLKVSRVQIQLCPFNSSIIRPTSPNLLCLSFPICGRGVIIVLPHSALERTRYFQLSNTPVSPPTLRTTACPRSHRPFWQQRQSSLLEVPRWPLCTLLCSQRSSSRSRFLSIRTCGSASRRGLQLPAVLFHFR